MPTAPHLIGPSSDCLSARHPNTQTLWHSSASPAGTLVQSLASIALCLATVVPSRFHLLITSYGDCLLTCCVGSSARVQPDCNDVRQSCACITHHGALIPSIYAATIRASVASSELVCAQASNNKINPRKKLDPRETFTANDFYARFAFHSIKTQFCPILGHAAVQVDR